MPALASELFGLSHFGLNYCLIGNSITIISFLVSNMLVGALISAPWEQQTCRYLHQAVYLHPHTAMLSLQGGYVYETRLIRHGDKGNVCIGADCFRSATFRHQAQPA